MALIQLQPKDVAKFWDGIKLSLERSSDSPSDVDGQFLNNALKEILTGRMNCWIIFSYTEDQLKQVHTIVVTSIRDDLLFGYKVIQVEAIYGFRSLSDEMLLDALEDLRKYARNIGCRYIRAITTNNRVKDICYMLGFNQFAYSYSLEV